MAIYGSMQHPYSTRRFVAAILAEPLSDIEVFNVTMGGGFGGKDDTAAIICARAALAARLTGRAVKIRYNREWSMRGELQAPPVSSQLPSRFRKIGTAQSCRNRHARGFGSISVRHSLGKLEEHRTVLWVPTWSTMSGWISRQSLPTMCSQERCEASVRRRCISPWNSLWTWPLRDWVYPLWILEKSTWSSRARRR